jgi:hypothetical protein
MCLMDDAKLGNRLTLIFGTLIDYKTRGATLWGRCSTGTLGTA